MMAMKVQYLSDGANSNRNDDHIAVFSCPEMTDLLVIDGGTSVAERDYIDPVHSDVAWFVKTFAAEIERVASPERSQQDSVDAAIGAVQSAYKHVADGAPVPVHAWPIAAVTWVRISGRDGQTKATLYSLGDCKTLLRTANGDVIDPDPYFNPQETVLQAEIARLRAAGVIDADERRERMLPMLRARRESQHRSPAPTVLCLQPQGPFQARTCTLELATGDGLLVMTDGFYRLVDPYGLYTDAGLLARCEERGPAALIDELRAFERSAGDTANRAVKAADDASAVYWVAGESVRQN